MAGNQFAEVFESQLMNAAKIVEEKLDAEINKLENLDEDDIEVIRQKRLEQLKKNQKQKDVWRSNGHGQYTELSEQNFFEECKKSDNIVIHFYRDTTFRCKIFDKHLSALCQKYIEARFMKVNAEKAPFLTERLNIKVLPSLVVIVGGKTKDTVVGFDDLGGVDDFPVAMLEWRLGVTGVIKYAGDLSEPPVKGKPKPAIFAQSKKSIRSGEGGQGDDSDTDEDWD